MNRSIRCIIAGLFACFVLFSAGACLAAGELSFPEKKITLYEGEKMAVPLVIQEGLEGDVKFVSSNRKIAFVDDEGMLNAVGKGQATISASMKVGKRTYVARLTVSVRRQVTGMKVSENKLTILERTEDGVLFEKALNVLADRLHDSFPEEMLETVDRLLILRKGVSVTFRVTMQPDGASDRTFTLSTDQKDTLKITQNAVKGINPGAGFLTVTSVSNPMVRTMYPYLVVTPVSKVLLKAEKDTLSIGEQTQVVMTCAPEEATLPLVRWKSDSERVATVDQNGLVTAHAKGKTAIRAITADGSERVSYVNVTVVQLPESVAIEGDSPVILNVGEKRQLKAAVLPESASDRKVSWVSTDETVATVSANGTVTAVGQGQCVIRCASQAREQVQAEMPVIVVQLVSEVSFPQKEGTLLTGDRALLRVLTAPADATNSAVSFSSSDPHVAAVAQDGIVTALASGDTVITASAMDGSGKEDRFRLSVVLRPERVEIHEQGPLSLLTGRKLQVTADVYPRTEDNRKIAWASTDESVAQVSPEGIVTGKAAGECDIVAVSQSDPSKTARIRLTVRERLKKIGFTESRVTVRERESVNTTLVLEPENFRLTEIAYTSRDESVATVDGNGVITGVSPGKTTIRVSALDGSGRYGQLTVTVLESPRSLTLDVSSLKLAMEDQVRLQAKGASSVIWESVRPDIATVDESGLVTAVSLGKTEIICTVKDFPSLKASAYVTVCQPVTSIQVTQPEVALSAGTQMRLSWAVYPGDAENPGVTMESTDPNVAAVDQSGVVTGLSKGTCEVVLRAADGFGQEARVKVTVNAGAVALRAEPAGLILTTGGKAVLNIYAAGEEGATFGMIWQSGTESVAVVAGRDNHPEVTGVGVGSALLTGVTLDGISRIQVPVRVEAPVQPPAVSSLKLEGSNVSLALLSGAERTFTRVLVQVSFYDLFGRLTAEQAVTYTLPLSPGAETVPEGFVWEKGQDGAPVPGRVTARVIRAESDGTAWDYDETVSPLYEAVSPGYLGYVPGAGDVAMPEAN